MGPKKIEGGGVLSKLDGVMNQNYLIVFKFLQHHTPIGSEMYGHAKK